MDDPRIERVRLLSEGQFDCLRLVAQHLSSKEIAGELGISRHTVDQRIRGALHVLGVTRRSEAARLVSSSSPPIRGELASGATAFPGPEDPLLEATRRSSLQWPFATKTSPRNEMSATQRLLWILLIGAMAAFAAGMYLAGLESLARLLQH
jgi:DNA-binding CsgD family transcriptional regulator